jgi:protoporphyrinogen oxidase
MNQKTAIIIGAGPAGLTAAHELLEKTDIKPIILEATNMVGGIARTVNYKGNRIDLGGHRFFSKSDTVMEWWLKILPLQYVPDLSGNSASSGPREGQNEANVNSKFDISYRGQKRSLDYLDMARDPADSFSPDPALRDPDKTDRVMLVRNRLSRIFYLRKFFSYPVSLNMTTVSNLGLLRMLKIGSSYLKTRLFPLKQEKTLEDFFINRFGNELYLTFFKDYTEKVWGVPCNLISAEWGAQRVKGLSVSKALIHALKQLLQKDSSIDQKKTETSSQSDPGQRRRDPF